MMNSEQKADLVPPEKDSVVLYPQKSARGWLGLALCLGGCVLGIVLLWENRGVGLAFAGLFGLLAAAMIAHLWPGMVYLRLSAQGFEVKNVRQRFFVNWLDVDSFFIARVGKGNYVAFRFVESLRPKRSAVSRLLVPADID